MTNRFTSRAQNALNHALREASLLGHTYIGSEHLLLGLLREENGIASKLMRNKGANTEKLRHMLMDLSGVGAETHVSPSDMTPRVRKIILDSATEASRCGQSYVGTEHILLALLDEPSCVAVRLLESASISCEDLRKDVTKFLSSAPNTTSSLRRDSSGETSRDTEPTSKDDLRVLRRDAGRESEREETRIPGMPTLSKYGRDLTALAQAGKLDPVIGRDAETERIIRVLSRRQKNNPCLIGEPGVGKTAVVEGLAQRIADGNVPETLRNRSIITMDLPGMVAGAKYRGEFEDRLKSVMNEVRKNESVILFIDEIHTIVGAGAAEGAVDAANILKPALSRGDMRLIGATTVTEYRQSIEKDAALERRFQAVTVHEPTPNETMKILQGLRPKYEAHHKIKITDEALQAAIDLSVRYIPDRFLPDKAIDLLDEAAALLLISCLTEPTDLKDLESELASVAREKEEAIKAQEFELAARLRDTERSKQEAYHKAKNVWEHHSHGIHGNHDSVTGHHVADIVTEWTGIPVSRLMQNENERLLELDMQLNRRVIGQDNAISTIANAIRRGRLGLKDPRLPIGSFIFLGQTGVGKTELTRALAAALFGSEKSLIRFDMSEYMEKHSISRLIGSPPGYIGHGEGGQLTERVRRQPYSVILFDELEKAHPDVLNILLQVLDDGSLTDAEGHRVNFSNTVIIMTSNLGAEASTHKSVGFSSPSEADREQETMLTAVKSAFRPEFLNRIDEIVLFKRLGVDEIHRIASLLLEEIRVRVMDLGIELNFSDDVISLLSEEGYDPTYGARPLRRAAVKRIEDPLAKEMLMGNIRAGDHVQANVQDGRLRFEKK